MDGAAAHAQSRRGVPTRSGSRTRAVCNSLYHAIFVSNVETGETKQVTDGLADAVWPVWDASGKYLWFLASTDFGLRSQWLDMTSYDREETFGLYFAVLQEGRAEPAAAGERRRSPASARPRRRRPGAWPRRRAGGASDGGEPAASRRADAARRARPVTVQIDFDGLQQRIISVPGVPERQYSQLQGRRRRARCSTSKPARGGGRGGGGGGSTLHRYR